MKQNGIPLNEIDLENSTITNIEETKISKNRGADITYGIDDVPPWYLCFFMALQHYLTMIGAIVSIPFILTPALCMAEDDPARSYIISTMIFVTGLVTLLQTTIGCRLPLVQGGTISFLVPTLAILSLPQWKCPAPEILEAMSHENRTELWQIRMRELSGAIAISALFQVIVGFGGIIGLMLKFITPLTIVPTVSLVGLSLFENAAEAASKHWGIAAGTILMLTMYSQILINVSVPIVMYRKGHGLRIIWFELFKLFPVLLTIVVMWIICTILTVTDTLPVGHPARSDSKIKIISDSPWFRIPYPGQWGVPTISLSGVLGMLAGVLACTVESISYYPTTSRMCGAPPPPVHAINRGIGIEGLGTMLAGLWGSGNGTNTFGENVGTIGVTKVGSRRVIQWACGLMILQGLISKFGAVFIIIPEPIVGGIFCVMFGMICAFGLSALQYVNLNSSRNLYILGFSIFFPMVLSKWMIKHADVINTGNDIVDGVITVLLSTTILVGGVIGCLLDNIIPGTDEERGLLAWSKEMELNVETSEEKQSEEYVPNTFDFPIGMKLLRRWKWTSYLPFSPTYKPNSGVYIATIRVQRYLNMPLVQRCSELAVLIDESSTTELQHVFPIIIDSLFGITDNIGWGLHNITYKKNPQEYEMLYNFLSPHGPIFSLCYKLLPDCYLKYNFPVSYLPSKIRSMLEEGVIPPFYLDKIRDDQGTRVPSALFMNPFEYYIFHFAYHLTNPWLQIQQQENVWVNWETVYVQSAHYYLHHFLPRDNSPVLPIIGPYIKKTPQRKLMQSPENKRESHRLQTPRLLRASILSPGSTNLVVGVPQQQCLPQVWRSETVIQVFLDFWMEYTEDDHMPSQMNMSYSTPIPHRHSIHSGEHIRLVRAFIKTLHEFANSSIGDKSAMDELKRIILPSVQGKIYVFLRKAIYHWPLDSSFRLILEAWLSFIQPWRYIAGVTYTKEGKPEEEERGKIHDPNRWITFVANNLLAYTVIFQQLLPRFMRTDLVAPKNALMLFRVTKVFSQPHLARILSEVESCMDDANLNRNRMQSSQWTSVVRQQIMELEGPTYQYIPMFSTTTITQVTFFLSIIKQAHLTATSLIEALEKRKRSQQFLVALWEFFYGEENSSDDISIEERRRVPIFLANAQQQLIDIFQISLEDIPQISITPDQEYHDSILSTSFHHQSQVDSSLDSSRPGVFVPIPDGRQNFRYIEYMGDPELQPVRSNECAYLVRNLYNFCSYINNKYQYEINILYNKRNFLGSICRQVLIPPTTIVKLPKRTINGFSSGSEELIPPRLSLRRLSNYGFLIFISASMFMAWITNYGVLWLLCLMFFIWFLYILIRAIFEPWFQSSTNTFRPNTTAFSIN